MVQTRSLPAIQLGKGMIDRGRRGPYHGSRSTATILMGPESIDSLKVHAASVAQCEWSLVMRLSCLPGGRVAGLAISN